MTCAKLQALFPGKVLRWLTLRFKSWVFNLKLLCKLKLRFFEEHHAYSQAKRDILELKKCIGQSCRIAHQFPKTIRRILYIRLDYWTQQLVGGSISHTIHVIKELHSQGIQVTAVLPQKYSELTQLGITQILLPHPKLAYDKRILAANISFGPLLDSLIEAFKPDIIYERVISGMYIVAKLVSQYQLPYVLEYNGSELVMNASFSRIQNFYENWFLDAENSVFAIASHITVVSDTIANDLTQRGIPPEKILVNPNGADPEKYCPNPELASKLRHQLGWAATDTVVGFIGTFGGWHGIDVMKAAILQLMSRINALRFILIGDGEHLAAMKAMVDEQQLHTHVLLTGMLPSSEAVVYLQTCDIYLSPQTDSLRGSPFYGSPVKLFEYMSLGKAIIASDLMQISQVLQPALRPQDLQQTPVAFNDKNAILIAPGNISDLVAAIVFLSNYPAIGQKLGSNARNQLLNHYTWKQHTQRILTFITKQN